MIVSVVAGVVYAVLFITIMGSQFVSTITLLTYDDTFTFLPTVVLLQDVTKKRVSADSSNLPSALHTDSHQTLFRRVIQPQRENQF